MNTCRYAPGRNLALDVLLILGLIGYGVLRYPAVLREGSAFTMRFTLVLLAAYGVAGVVVWRRTGEAAQVALHEGTRIGLLLSAVMMLHMTAEYFVAMGPFWNTVLSLGLFPVLFLGFGIAGGKAALATGRGWLGLLSSVWCAMLCIVVVCLYGFLVNYAFMPHMETLLRHSEEFKRSGMHDLTAFTVLNSVELAGSHLLIAPLLATIFGGVGGLVGKSLARSTSIAKTVPPSNSSTSAPLTKLVAVPS